MTSTPFSNIFNSDKKILVVDDVTSARKVILRLLKTNGIEFVEQANNGQQALERAQKGDIALIISDWEMPELNGIELLESLRAAELTKQIPFIMVTSSSDREIVITAAKMGVTDYVVKPFSASILAEKIARVMKLEI